MSSEAKDEAKKIVDDTKNFFDKALADINKTSATKQLILGSASGWLTGFLAMKLGRIAAVGIGGSCILLHVANEKGYIDINWDKICKKVDKISDKIEKETTGSSPAWIDKVERFVDKKLDKAEELIEKKKYKAKSWYHKATGDDHYRATETHIFMASFFAGVAVGMMCGNF